MKRMVLATAAAGAALAMAACHSGLAQPDDGGGSLSVYATTGYLADAVANIAPEAEVATMVGPGGDPHTYQPSTRDIEMIWRADVVLWIGLHLEAHLADQLRSLGEKQLAVGEQLPTDLLLDWPETDAAGNPLHDPHVWNSPEAWSVVVEVIAAKLGEADPSNASTYRRNAAEYAEEIARAATEAEELLAAVPAPRILVTGHDAFNYFGQTFGFDVRATDFISSEAALSARELSDLARLIAENEVPVIFHDNQANPQAITSLTEAVRALGWEVEISREELFADSLGPEPPVDTYLGVFAHNARAVASALGRAARGRRGARGRPPNPDRTPGGPVTTTPPPACAARNLSAAYGSEPVLRNVTLTVPQGVVMGIVGPNGAGKSTLLKSMLGLLTPLTGTSEFFGRPLDEVRHRVGYMPQAATVDWDFPTTVRDVVTMGTYGRLGWVRRPGRAERARAARAMDHAGIADLSGRQIGELSGGQRQRTFLARTLAQDPDLLLMDEPFQGIDARSQQAIVEVLHHLRRQGATVVMVHHDLATVRAYCDHVTLLNREVIASGPLAKAFTPAHIRTAYDVADGAEELAGFPA